jgi:hypothetical protein
MDLQGRLLSKSNGFSAPNLLGLVALIEDVVPSLGMTERIGALDIGGHVYIW